MIHFAQPPLGGFSHILLFFTSLLIVAYGQPAGIPWLSGIAALIGYGMMCWFLLDIPRRSQRFWLGTFWFTAVQAIQLSWMLSHPYNYIYFVYTGFSLLWGMQWGFFALFITHQNVTQLPKVFGLASLWTLLEWSRLFFLSGYTWNPAGIALTENLYSLQFVSLGGVFALSFWVIFVNILGLRAWITRPRIAPISIWLLSAALPYVFGFGQLYMHDKPFNKDAKAIAAEPLNALLVQTAFPAEEALNFKDKNSYIAFILEEWKQLFTILHPHIDKKVDLVALPEYVVPFGTYTFIFPHAHVKEMITSLFGAHSKDYLPRLESPFAKLYDTNKGPMWFVNNAFLVQSIANLFQADVIAGLEDAEDDVDGERKYYSAALHFQPNVQAENSLPKRYSKRVLLPMAEYIPFAGFNALAKLYGIQGSFTCGKEATLFQGNKVPFGASICYEETFGHLMRECKHNGAELLVNLTSDIWYPNSNLPKQHFDHGRLRAVENGIPLIRACNTGITSVVDSLGRTVAMLGDTSYKSQWISEALYAEVPRYHYPTLYSRFGDWLILAISFCGVLFLWRRVSIN